MNDDKLKKLFELARAAQAPVPPAGFDGDVMRAIRNEPRGRGGTSLFEELGALFPRLAWVAVALIVLCAVADFGLRSTGGPDMDEGLAQVSNHWLFTSDGF